MHTLFLLVGPSGCGKSYFSKNVLIPKLQAELDKVGVVPNVQYISSDDLRREVLGDISMHKHDPQMMEASKAAFELLHKRIDLAMSHPTLAHFTVVDTTGLSKQFRGQILEQAKEKNYNVACIIFDYKKNDEYYKYCEDDSDYKGHVTRKHIDRLRKVFYKEFDRKPYKRVHKIKSKDFSEIEFEFTNMEQYAGCILDSDTIYDIIGDVHGCLEDLQNLVSKLGYEIDDNGIIKGHIKDSNRKMILVGDLVDKGPDSEGVLNFVLTNMDYFISVKGNHENFVAKWHKGLLKNIDMTDEFRKEYFDTSFVESSSFKAKIAVLDDISVPFARGPGFIVTHGPARNVYLEKIDRISLKEQLKGKPGRGDIDQDSDEALNEFYAYLKEENERSYPWHVFGHVPLRRRLQLGNKLGIDTGCVHGGELTAVTFFGGKPHFTTVKGTGVHQDKPLNRLFYNPEKKFDFNLDDLEPREVGRIKWATEEKVNYISGTMSPSAADPEKGEIEPLEKAFEYFDECGIEQLVLQPKYMGSRCNLYLHRDIKKCYATSRKGYKIKHVELEEVYKTWKKKLFDNPMFHHEEWIILDGELLPWSALGEGLIEHTFKAVEKGIESELQFLKETGFEDALEAIQSNPAFVDYQEDQVKGSKQEMIKKYGHHNVSTYKCLMEYKHHSIKQHEAGLEVYKRQLEVFGSPGEPEFKAFNILKTVKTDGTNELWNDNYEVFNLLNDDQCVLVNLKDMETDEAYAFFEKVTNDKEMEGVVVKPRFEKEHVAPFMKVRSKRYLTIVYGYDYLFEEKYNRLINSKRVNGKLRTSINEYEIGKKLLQIDRADITPENVEYQKLIANMIAEEKKEEKFDPRL